ncbi:MAG: hypothetical protein KUG77_01965 [Nannocystaceae bacterium]|nr:hypothetical protein [Nannocystaceae bacterium]
MRLKPCSSCERLLRAGDGCPFCGEAGAPTTFAPTMAAMLLSLPLLAAAGCTRPAESIYGGPEMLDPTPPAATDSTTPGPEEPAEADPQEPSEPQGEIYGSPQMMDSSAEGPVEADPPEPPQPEEPIYGGPDMMDPEPAPVPERPKKRGR